MREKNNFQNFERVQLYNGILDRIG